MKLKTAHILFYMVLSNLLYSLGFVLCYIPNQIAAGGFGGVATALCELLPLTPGLLTFLMTLPFLIWGGFEKGWLFSVSTFLSSLLFSAFVDGLLWLPPLTRDPLLAAIFGGVFCSLGTVFMLKAGVSAGGTDLVAQLIRFHFPYISHGSLLLAFNVLCVLIAVVVYGNIQSGLYSVIAIYVASTFADHFTSGQEKIYMAHIITKSPPEPIAREVEAQLRRSVTLQQGVGMYSHQDQNILLIVVKPSELYRLRDIVNTIDPGAFVVFTLGSGAYGGGFQGPKGRYPNAVPEPRFPLKH